jgi:lipopolysaccharide export system protein LptA
VMGKIIKTVAVLGSFAVGILAFGQHGFAQSALRSHDADQPIDIIADQLEVRQNDDLAIFKGTVEASQGDLKLMADTLTVFYVPNQSEGDPAIARIDAAGTVSITSPSESADGQWGVYDVIKRLITVGGNVTLRRGDSVLVGERLEIDLITGVTRFDGASISDQNDQMGRVRGSFSLPEDEQDPNDDGEGDDVGKTRNHR